MYRFTQDVKGEKGRREVGTWLEGYQPLGGSLPTSLSVALGISPYRQQQEEGRVGY